MVAIAGKILLSGFLYSQGWQFSDRSSAGLAPLPKDEPRAVVQVYAARTYGWRGTFAVHSWIAVKLKNGNAYQTFHVIGWRLRRDMDVVVVEDSDVPDGKWFGSTPQLIRDLRGPGAERAIPKIYEAAKTYPYQRAYRAWPGPNSNSFVSHILRRTPEIGVELPPNAIGKDWIDDGDLFGVSETRTGFQFSLFGVVGFILGLGDGISINLLGMEFGVDILRPALKLPFIGRVGFQDSPVFDAGGDDEPKLKQDKIQPMVVD